jgi:cellulose biosynthesis protein BcsQ
MSKEIFVAFATQNGGIGKSTVTALAASSLHNVKGYNVAVVDCDDPQHSIHGLREHEMGLIDSSTYFQRLSLATISAGSKRTPTPSSKAMR